MNAEAGQRDTCLQYNSQSGKQAGEMELCTQPQHYNTTGIKDIVGQFAQVESCDELTQAQERGREDEGRGYCLPEGAVLMYGAPLQGPQQPG